MQKHCKTCGKYLDPFNIDGYSVTAQLGKKPEYECDDCHYGNQLKLLIQSVGSAIQPQHYHKYDMDTFTFLEKGFKPEVLEGFLIGNIIKYVQRFEHKNGLEDLEKAKVYLDKLIESKKKSHS